MYPRLELKAYKWYLPIGWCCRSQDCGEGTWARNIAPCFQGSLAARTPLKHWPCAPSWSEPGRMFLKCLQLVSAVSPSPESSQELSFKGRLWPISFFEITEQASVSSLPSQQLDEGRGVLCDTCLLSTLLHCVSSWMSLCELIYLQQSVQK